MNKSLIAVLVLIFAALACTTAPQAESKIPPELIAATKVPEYSVTAETLRIRYYPSLNAPETGEYLYSGDVVTCFQDETVAEWFNGQIVSTAWCNVGQGWVSMKYLTLP